MRYTDKELKAWFAEACQKGFRFVIVCNDRYFHDDSYYADFANNPEEVYEKAKKADDHGGSCEAIYILVDANWEDFFFYSLQWKTLELYQLREKLSHWRNGIFRYRKRVAL